MYVNALIAVGEQKVKALPNMIMKVKPMKKKLKV